MACQHPRGYFFTTVLPPFVSWEFETFSWNNPRCCWRYGPPQSSLITVSWNFQPAPTLDAAVCKKWTSSCHALSFVLEDGRALYLLRLLSFFCGRRPLPFSGSHSRLPSGQAGIRSTTGSLSALAPTEPPGRLLLRLLSFPKHSSMYVMLRPDLQHVLNATFFYCFLVFQTRCLSIPRRGFSWNFQQALDVTH